MTQYQAQLTSTRLKKQNIINGTIQSQNNKIFSGLLDNDENDFSLIVASKHNGNLSIIETPINSQFRYNHKIHLLEINEDNEYEGVWVRRFFSKEEYEQLFGTYASLPSLYCTRLPNPDSIINYLSHKPGNIINSIVRESEIERQIKFLNNKSHLSFQHI